MGAIIQLTTITMDINWDYHNKTGTLGHPFLIDKIGLNIQCHRVLAIAIVKSWNALHFLPTISSLLFEIISLVQEETTSTMKTTQL